MICNCVVKSVNCIIFITIPQIQSSTLMSRTGPFEYTSALKGRGPPVQRLAHGLQTNAPQHSLSFEHCEAKMINADK